jgi:ABC-type antimicrobial peptide transport system permease subunit
MIAGAEADFAAEGPRAAVRPAAAPLEALGLLLLVILLAGLLPAKRAVSLDVARALREG